MYAIYTYENGLRFIGKVSLTEADAWKWLDETYGKVINGVKYPCNHAAFKVVEVDIVK